MITGDDANKRNNHTHTHKNFFERSWAGMRMDSSRQSGDEQREQASHQLGHGGKSEQGGRRWKYHRSVLGNGRRHCQHRADQDQKERHRFHSWHSGTLKWVRIECENWIWKLNLRDATAAELGERVNLCSTGQCLYSKLLIVITKSSKRNFFYGRNSECSQLGSSAFDPMHSYTVITEQLSSGDQLLIYYRIILSILRYCRQ